MDLLSDEERLALMPAETLPFDSPIPTQSVSSDEFAPIPQTPRAVSAQSPSQVELILQLPAAFSKRVRGA